MNHAKFARASYSLNLANKNKEKRIAKAHEHLPAGYRTDPRSNRDVSLFINDDAKHAVIAHRGTDLSKRRDLGADILFALGQEKHSKEFDKRSKQSMKLAKDLPEEYKLDFTGHSYGGASAMHSIKKHPKLRERVSEIHLYNPLTAPWSSKTHVRRGGSVANADKEIDDKTTVHRVRGDIVSMAGTHGNVVEHEPKRNHKPAVMPDQFKGVFQTLDQLATHAIKNFV